jgi:hypothetical protein
MHLIFKPVGVAAVVAALAGVLPAAASADPGSYPLVCNEAQNSPRGVLTVTDPSDPNPPARHKDAAMPVGNGHGVGLANAAENSPALALCDTGDGGGGDPFPT